MERGLRGLPISRNRPDFYRDSTTQILEFGCERMFARQCLCGCKRILSYGLEFGFSGSSASSVRCLARCAVPRTVFVPSAQRYFSTESAAVGIGWFCNYGSEAFRRRDSEEDEGGHRKGPSRARKRGRQSKCCRGEERARGKSGEGISGSLRLILVEGGVLYNSQGCQWQRGYRPNESSRFGRQGSCGGKGREGTAASPSRW